MSNKNTIPSLRWSTIFLVALSLSIGWGIRGNFGHEYGAMVPGCLAAIAVCVLSGREDWRRRVAFFAFFGAVGWGFGGSISYMQVISYTHAGHLPSRVYGYAALFYIGFLWAALGGAGTALPAVADHDRLTQLFKPILFIFGVWFILVLIEEPVAAYLKSLIMGASGPFDKTWHRHESPLYWLDADWLPAVFALIGVCLFDLYDRCSGSGVRHGVQHTALLTLFAAAGAGLGWLVQTALAAYGLAGKIGAALTMPLGDPNAINPETGLRFDPGNLLTNWPEFFLDLPQHLGWGIGLVVGVGVYFAIFGKWRSGSSLFLHMALGWILCFLAFPVLGSLLAKDYGGIRMTPPRADDWAGITGVFIGATIWFLRNDLKPVAFASTVSGFIGGFAFSGMQCLKQLMFAPGNPFRLNPERIDPSPTEAIEKAWALWQHQNWHSFLEQSYGFVNGIAIAVALGLIATRVKTLDDGPEPPRRWTGAFSAFFALIGLTYLNLFKNVRVWVEQMNPAWRPPQGATGMREALWDIPLLGRLPGLDTFEFAINPYVFVAANAILLAILIKIASPTGRTGLGERSAAQRWAGALIVALAVVDAIILFSPGATTLRFELTPSGWFRLTYVIFTIAFVILAQRHFRRPIAILPQAGPGKGQVLYLALLWAMDIGNLERALGGFSEGRLITEWVIFVNAVIATVMILACPRDQEPLQIRPPKSFAPWIVGAWMVGIAMTALTIAGTTWTTRTVYDDHFTGHAGRQGKPQTRFGPDAEWRNYPNLKNKEHR